MGTAAESSSEQTVQACDSGTALVALDTKWLPCQYCKKTSESVFPSEDTRGKGREEALEVTFFSFVI